MKKPAVRALAALLFMSGAYQAFAQNYPTARPKPKPTASRTAAPTSSPSAEATSDPGTQPTPKLPTGPLKMITTDGTNKQSPIRVVEINYYDEGYGTKYNSEVRVSGTVQNTGKKELKKVVVHLQIVDGAGQLIYEWKETPGVLKAGQSYSVRPSVWRNSLGTLLKARMIVDHEEVVEKDGSKGTT